MDPRERRLETLRAARLAAILAGNALLAVLLVLVLRRGAERGPRAAAPQAEVATAAASQAMPGAERAASAGAPPAVEGDALPGGGEARAPAASGAGPASKGASGADAGGRLSDQLTRGVEGAVARAVARSAELSKGAVGPRDVRVAVVVRELGGVRELVLRQADAALVPASNMKLVTVAAALAGLGPDFRFETRFEAAGPLAGGTLDGDLVARAGGDPWYDGGEGSLDRWLDDLARRLRAAGVERVRGALVLDEDPYLEPGPGPGWPPESQHWAEWCALAAGFSANAGCLSAHVRAGAAGGAASVRVLPRDHGLARSGEVRTGSRGSRLDVAVGVQGGRAVVRGSVPAGLESWSARFAHPDPVALFGEGVARGLARRGIEIEGGWRRGRGAAGGAELARVGTPLVDLLAPILADSNNAAADQLFLATGAALAGAGTRAGGRAATARALARLGLSAEGLVQVDGSGLSREDRVTARQLVALLEAVLARGDEAARLFESALPLAGESGSLSGRMRSSPARGRVRAKTGWISGASSLSGIADGARGRRFVFSILVAYPRVSGLNTHCWKPMQDEICALLAQAGDDDV